MYYFQECELEMQIPEPPPALGCSFSKSSKVNLQVSWYTNKPEAIPQQWDVHSAQVLQIMPFIHQPMPHAEL